jgi:hypothetical protein
MTSFPLPNICEFRTIHLNQPGRKRMRFYRVRLLHRHGASNGFEYFTTKKEALAYKREYVAQKVLEDMDDNDGNDFGLVQGFIKFEATVEVIEIEPNKRGILDALRELASHPNNG